MKKLIIIMVLIFTASCPKDSFMKYPPPPYPNPDITIHGEWDVRYEWRCLHNDYVLVIFYLHSSGAWKEIEERAPGICTF